MQPLNNDMDELMRRAAADYPVIPQGADWEKVAQQLGGAAMPAKTGQYGDIKKLLLLLPLLLASFVCDRFLQYEYGLLKKLSSTNTETGTAEPDRHPVVTNGSKATNTSVNNTTVLNTGVKNGIATPPLLLSGAVKKTRYGIANPSESGNTTFESGTGVPHNENQQSATAPYRPLMLSTKQQIASPAAENIQPHNLAVTQLLQTSQPKKTGQEPDEKWYASVLMGPDWSRVKDQKIKAAGYSVGAIVGYNLSRKWAVETGLIWDKKNYYSNGEYFKTDKINLPQHSQIIMVDGYCGMFEIPLNIRFNAVNKQRNVLYASAGVSSYLMKKEDYDYVYRHYNEDYSGNKVYTNESKDWFAVANAAVGYEHRLGEKTKIRIEPYIRVPLKGVGIGSLPLSSTGILVGITYPIH